jgi:flavin reductase (DIM6/NTAB) family NADH-FMN oxidoreductase RutF
MPLINQPQSTDGMTRSDGQARPAPAVAPGAREMRGIFGRFATGITVVTAGREIPRGMTANSFTSVSLEPPLVLVCIQRNATMHETISEAGSFAVSVLAAHQERVARLFADRKRPRGKLEFDAVDAIPGPHTGAPVLSGALAWLECKLATTYDGGDHSIFLGEVETIGRGKTEDALLFYDGGFHRLESEALWPNTT